MIHILIFSSQKFWSNIDGEKWQKKRANTSLIKRIICSPANGYAFKKIGIDIFWILFVI